jgi:hypothetical protein
VREQYDIDLLTSASFKPVLVPEGRESVRHHLHELQSRALVVVPLLERLYESLKRPAEFLGITTQRLVI